MWTSRSCMMQEKCSSHTGVTVWSFCIGTLSSSTWLRYLWNQYFVLLLYHNRSTLTWLNSNQTITLLLQHFPRYPVPKSAWLNSHLPHISNWPFSIQHQCGGKNSQQPRSHLLCTIHSHHIRNAIPIPWHHAGNFAGNAQNEEIKINRSSHQQKKPYTS